MREVINISISLIRIPRLFLSLFLFPILLSLLIVFIQLVVVSLVLQATSNSANNHEAQLTRIEKKESVLRNLLLGQASPFEKLAVCRWQQQRTASGQLIEVPPQTDACQPDRLDVAVHVDDPATADVDVFAKYIEGNAQRLHVCRSCTPDLVIKVDSGEASLHTYSVVASMIVPLFYRTDDIKQIVLEVDSAFGEVNDTFGSIYIHLPGFDQPISLDQAKADAGLIVNIITILLISLWLTIKAHRNVLDYFARNGALLPIVASVGSHVFYRAIWFLTLFRVSIFLFAAVPLTILFAYSGNLADTESGLFTASTIPDVIWIVALTAGLGLAALISSIGELQHRHYFFSFVYKYVSLIVCLFGALVWLFTFLSLSDVSLLFRDIVASLPVVGLTPILLTPILRPSFYVLAIHTTLSIGCMLLILRYNQRWFAAHLEEL